MSSAAVERLGRGVWWLPVRAGGCRVLIIVDSRGERVKQLRVLPETDGELLVRRAEAFLDRVDPPRPTLSLVKPEDAASRPRQLTVEQLDAIYRDADPIAAMVWQRKREKIKGLLRPLPRPT